MQCCSTTVLYTVVGRPENRRGISTATACRADCQQFPQYQNPRLSDSLTGRSRRLWFDMAHTTRNKSGLLSQPFRGVVRDRRFSIPFSFHSHTANDGLKSISLRTPVSRYDDSCLSVAITTDTLLNRLSGTLTFLSQHPTHPTLTAHHQNYTPNQPVMSDGLGG